MLSYYQYGVLNERSKMQIEMKSGIWQTSYLNEKVSVEID